MQSLSAPILIGMPHLSYGGLSENWLLKECGHLHWMLLANAMGMPVPDFRDAHGNRLYAAFIAVRVGDSDLGAIREHDSVRIRSAVARLSRTQFRSTHAVICGHRERGCVEMVSVFLRRALPGCNRSVERAAAVERGSGLAHLQRSEDSELGRITRAMRHDAAWTHFGLSRTDRAPAAKFHFAPSPFNDFNGADFLYFASFQALVDRAEWAWWNTAQRRTLARDLFFHGNVDIGEALTVVLCAQRRTASTFVHWCEIVCDSDGRKIADVFTSRVPLAADLQAAEAGIRDAAVAGIPAE